MSEGNTVHLVHDTMVDHGELGDASPAHAFILGVEYGMVAEALHAAAPGRYRSVRVVHQANLERLRALADDYQVETITRELPDGFAEVEFTRAGPPLA